MKKRKKLKIRINPTKSPFKLIRKKFNHTTLLGEEEAEIKEEEKFANVDRYINQLKKVQMIIDEEKHEEKQFQLIKMMYSDDIDTEYAVNNLDISEKELGYIVNELVELGLVHFISDDEAEITIDGIKYIKYRDSQFES